MTAVIAALSEPWHDEKALARFWSKVDKRGSDECWLWLGVGASEYGRFRVNHVKYRAHVFSWMVAHRREFPSGMIGCHQCDNPPCVNPAHIWPGTYRDNLLDSHSKGRARPIDSKLGTLALQARTHCPHGHEFSAENTCFSARRGWRSCRECTRLRRRRQRAAARGTAAA